MSEDFELEQSPKIKRNLTKRKEKQEEREKKDKEKSEKKTTTRKKKVDSETEVVEKPKRTRKKKDEVDDSEVKTKKTRKTKKDNEEISEYKKLNSDSVNVVEQNNVSDVENVQTQEVFEQNVVNNAEQSQDSIEQVETGNVEVVQQQENSEESQNYAEFVQLQENSEESLDNVEQVSEIEQDDSVQVQTQEEVVDLEKYVQGELDKLGVTDVTFNEIEESVYNDVLHDIMPSIIDDISNRVKQKFDGKLKEYDIDSHIQNLYQEIKDGIQSFIEDTFNKVAIFNKIQNGIQEVSNIKNLSQDSIYKIMYDALFGTIKIHAEDTVDLFVDALCYDIENEVKVADVENKEVSDMDKNFSQNIIFILDINILEEACDEVIIDMLLGAMDKIFNNVRSQLGDTVSQNIFDNVKDIVTVMILSKVSDVRNTIFTGNKMEVLRQKASSELNPYSTSSEVADFIRPLIETDVMGYIENTKSFMEEKVVNIIKENTVHQENKAYVSDIHENNELSPEENLNYDVQSQDNLQQADEFVQDSGNNQIQSISFSEEPQYVEQPVENSVSESMSLEDNTQAIDLKLDLDVVGFADTYSNTGDTQMYHVEQDTEQPVHVELDESLVLQQKAKDLFDKTYPYINGHMDESSLNWLTWYYYDTIKLPDFQQIGDSFQRSLFFTNNGTNYVNLYQNNPELQYRMGYMTIVAFKDNMQSSFDILFENGETLDENGNQCRYTVDYLTVVLINGVVFDTTFSNLAIPAGKFMQWLREINGNNVVFGLNMSSSSFDFNSGTLYELGLAGLLSYDLDSGNITMNTGENYLVDNLRYLYESGY